MFKELDITLEHPAIEDKHSIRIHVAGYEVRDGGCDWHFSIVQWQTYSSEFADDVHHNLYDVWLTTGNDDLLELLDEFKQLFLNKL